MKKDKHEEMNEIDDIVADNLAEDAVTEPDEQEGTDGNESDNLSEEYAKLKDTYIRLLAEYDNYRKRTIKEKADLIKNGGEKILTGLLPVMDDFERAIDNIDKAKDLDAVKEGVDLIYHKFLTFLSQNGVKPIETIGKPFNDETDEAVAIVPAQNEEQKGTVIDSVQTGYLLNDKVIRHAKVVVAD